MEGNLKVLGLRSVALNLMIDLYDKYVYFYGFCPLCGKIVDQKHIDEEKEGLRLVVKSTQEAKEFFEYVLEKPFQRLRDPKILRKWREMHQKSKFLGTLMRAPPTFTFKKDFLEGIESLERIEPNQLVRSRSESAPCEKCGMVSVTWYFDEEREIHWLCEECALKMNIPWRSESALKRVQELMKKAGELLGEEAA